MDRSLLTSQKRSLKDRLLNLQWTHGQVASGLTEKEFKSQFLELTIGYDNFGDLHTDAPPCVPVGGAHDHVYWARVHDGHGVSDAHGGGEHGRARHHGAHAEPAVPGREVHLSIADLPIVIGIYDDGGTILYNNYFLKLQKYY